MTSNRSFSLFDTAQNLATNGISFIVAKKDSTESASFIFIHF